MNLAAHELGKLAGEIAHQRAREPVLAKARAIREAIGLEPHPALTPPLILTLGDRA
jgi:hypothetical protein